MNDFSKSKNININFSDSKILEYLYKDDYWTGKLCEIRAKFDFNKKVNIKVVGSVDELSGQLGNEVPSWVIGTYRRNLIYILKYEVWESRNLGSFAQVMTHEFTHIALSSKLKQRCPIWLNEGLALYFADQYKTVKLSKENISEDDIYQLDYSCDYLYDISAKAVEKLAALYGIDSIINKLSIEKCFKEDEVVGVENMKRVLSVIKSEL